LREIGELFILGNFFWRQMAMIVDDRLSFDIIMIKLDRGFIVEQKIFGDEEVFHGHYAIFAGSNFGTSR
jgi:hypothetical protein